MSDSNLQHSDPARMPITRNVAEDGCGLTKPNKKGMVKSTGRFQPFKTYIASDKTLVAIADMKADTRTEEQKKALRKAHDDYNAQFDAWQKTSKAMVDVTLGSGEFVITKREFRTDAQGNRHATIMLTDKKNPKSVAEMLKAKDAENAAMKADLAAIRAELEAARQAVKASATNV